MNFLLSALVSLTVSLVSAQEYNTSSPFVLKLSSNNANVSGNYLSSCHSGAAIEQLCLSGTSVPANDYGTYALNVSASASDTDEAYTTGSLVWSLQTGSLNISSGLSIISVPYSNVDFLVFEPSDGNYHFGFDEDDNLFVYSSSYDESQFTPGVLPTAVTPAPLYHVSSPFKHLDKSAG